jgi:hypothetical protein
MSKIDAATVPKVILADFVTKYGFASKKVKNMKAVIPGGFAGEKPLQPTIPKDPRAHGQFVRRTREVVAEKPPKTPRNEYIRPIAPKDPRAHGQFVRMRHRVHKNEQSTPEKRYAIKTSLALKHNGKQITGELKTLNNVTYKKYPVLKIFKHGKAVSLGMFGADNHIRGIVDTWCYVPSKDIFVIALKARSDINKKAKDINTVYGVEFTYDANIKYKIRVSKDSAVLLNDFQGNSDELIEETKEAMIDEYENAIILPITGDDPKRKSPEYDD